MSTNLSLTFKQVPTGMPIAGQDLAVEDVGPFDDASPPPPGGIIVESLYASFDPYLRGRMRPSPPGSSYIPSFQPGKPVSTMSLARVLKSDTPDIRAGATIVANIAVQERVALDADALRSAWVQPVADAEHGGPKDPRDWLGALGLPGLTAYSSLYGIGKPKKGEVIFISSAAGGVGQIVGQLAKREGLKVIGSAGSDEKCGLCVEKLGFDACWNYKTVKAGEALDKYCPDGIDIYYDNVGGEQLDAALERMKKFGRIVACGMISGYNVVDPAERYGVKSLINIIPKSITMRGFIVSDPDMMAYQSEFVKNITTWLNDGSLTTVSHEWVGINEAANACIGVLKGENFGKAILKIKV